MEVELIDRSAKDKIITKKKSTVMSNLEPVLATPSDVIWYQRVLDRHSEPALIKSIKPVCRFP